MGTNILEFVPNLYILANHSAISMIETYNELCSSQTDKHRFDDYVYDQIEKNLRLNRSIGPICCRGLRSCTRSQILYYPPSTNLDEDILFCSGSNACAGDLSFDFIQTTGKIFCFGRYSCEYSNIANFHYLSCGATSSCYTA